jgi:aryl-alcohol dehydrogenase-like predicted oxidoreductase
LQTDYIDLYLLHGGTINDPIDETIEAFEHLKHQGKIRFYGISSIRPNVIREYVNRSSITSVMMQYSLLDRRPEETCLDLLKKHNIGVLARGSVAQGLLVNKAPKPYLAHTPEQVSRAAESIAAITSTGSSPAQTAIRYALAHDAVASAVVGIRTAAQLAEAVAAAALPRLSGAELSGLRNQVPADTYKEHR